MGRDDEINRWRVEIRGCSSWSGGSLDDNWWSILFMCICPLEVSISIAGIEQWYELEMSYNALFCLCNVWWIKLRKQAPLGGVQRKYRSIDGSLVQKFMCFEMCKSGMYVDVRKAVGSDCIARSDWVSRRQRSLLLIRKSSEDILSDLCIWFWEL